MCNACGFYCCAYDGFSKCGCDHCPNPECWDDEDGFDSDDCSYYEDDETDPQPQPVARPA